PSVAQTPSRAARRVAHPRLRKLAESAAILLVVVLPVLLAFVAIDQPPGDAELARVEQAVFPERANVSEPLQMYYGWTVPAGAAAQWGESAGRLAVTTRARFAGMLALFVLSAQVYLLMLMVRGRATGVLSCLLLAVLPPVFREGFVLRPEPCATVFGMLGILALAGYPLLQQRSRRRGVGGWVSHLAIWLVVGSTFALACACLRNAVIYLAVAAGTLLLSVLALGFLWPRAARGKHPLHWPLRAAARRYAPWMMVLLCAGAMLFVVLVQIDGQRIPEATKTSVGLLPANFFAKAGVLSCAVAGVLRLGLGVGLRLGRLRRVRPDAVLLIYVAALLLQHAIHGQGTADALPAALALACLSGDGAMTLVVLTVSRFAKRQRGG
ncbi:MAG: hypothetical protein KDC87_20135, partial [Planctomycetes bacterium]|nr:hypothetical protein [Planctomycetota bacterium]